MEGSEYNLKYSITFYLSENFTVKKMMEASSLEEVKGKYTITFGGSYSIIDSQGDHYEFHSRDLKMIKISEIKETQRIGNGNYPQAATNR
jgi:hypothetical protein